MLLKIRVDCPICLAEVEWIYDVEKARLHRASMGCPGGCTAIQEIGVREITEEEAQEFLDTQAYPRHDLDNLTNDG